MDDENNTPGREIISCPDPDRWLDLAAGALPRATSDRMLAHAAACNDCSLHLREAAAVFGEDTPEVMAAMHALSSSTPEWRGRTAAMLARTSRPPKTPVLRRWLSVAAAFLVVSGGALYFYWRAAQPPFGALATAYSLDRGIELRIPGASYAPMKIERGGASHRPAELLESQGAITRHLQRDPQDGRWLHARGLAEILDRRYSDAIASLRLALDLTAGGTKAAAAIYLDLATAYYGRAETERRAIDYSAALNALGQAIQINPTTEAYFNRAVINEKLHYYEPALADWKRYLELDPSSEWAKEAQERRDALVKKTGALRMDDPHRLDDLPEIQLERAMAAGLPHNADTSVLAERLRQEHGDRWLAEALQAPPAGAIATLASMVASHASYALAQFPEQLHRLNAIDGSRLPHALQAWLEAEKLYRVSNSPNSAKCPDGADALIEKCRASGYASLLIQTMLERSTCLYTSGDVAGGTDLSREALREANEHRLPIAALRAAGFLGIRLVTAGLYREVAELNRRELDIFWSRPFPPIRAQNFYHTDMVVDEALGWYFAAQSAAAMSNRISELAGMTVTQAVTNARLGLFEERAGMHAEAVRHWTKSRDLFSRVARNSTSDEFRAYAESQAAEAESSRGALLELEPAIRENTNPMVVVPYLLAAARIERRAGKGRDAEARLERAAQWLTGNPPREGERVRRWRGALDTVYRDLAAVRLDRGAAEEAYRARQEFLAADAALLGGHSLPVAESEGIPAAVVTFARLNGRYAAWLHGRGTPVFRWIEGDAAATDQLVRQYAALCAQAQFGAVSGERIGAQLYATLLAPLLGGSVPRALLIQPDGELFRLPWNALLVGAQPLGSLAYVAVTPLPVGSPAMLPMFKPSGPALVVAATEIASRLAPDFPTLPDLDLEIDAVHQALPSATVLRGGQATVSAINSLLPGSGMLHFAGHSAPMPDGLRLVVAPDESHPDGLWLPTPESSACNIAILSACATGRYEEFESTDPHHLAHAFLLAGTRGVVASQWRVDSKATARFMKIFYGYVGGGSSVPEALQRASSEIRQRQEWRHPYYWSSFTLFVQS